MTVATAASAKFHYVCAHDMRAENRSISGLRRWDAVRDEAQGQLEVRAHTVGRRRFFKVSLAKLLNNEIAFHMISGMPLSTIVPVAAMEGLPFAFAPRQRRAAYSMANSAICCAVR